MPLRMRRAHSSRMVAFFFGEDISLRKANEWGWIEIHRLTDMDGRDLTSDIQYIQPNDGNKDDQTVLEIPLDKPLQSGDTIILDFEFTSKQIRLQQKRFLPLCALVSTNGGI